MLQAVQLPAGITNLATSLANYPSIYLSVYISIYLSLPCSKQYSSQQALPIWQPAWPTIYLSIYLSVCLSICTYHAPSSTAPSRHYQSGNRPGQHGLKCTPSETKTETLGKRFLAIKS